MGKNLKIVQKCGRFSFGRFIGVRVVVEKVFWQIDRNLEG